VCAGVRTRARAWDIGAREPERRLAAGPSLAAAAAALTPLWRRRPDAAAAAALAPLPLALALPPRLGV